MDRLQAQCLERLIDGVLGKRYAKYQVDGKLSEPVIVADVGAKFAKISRVLEERCNFVFSDFLNEKSCRVPK